MRHNFFQQFPIAREFKIVLRRKNIIAVVDNLPVVEVRRDEIEAERTAERFFAFERDAQRGDRAVAVKIFEPILVEIHGERVIFLHDRLRPERIAARREIGKLHAFIRRPVRRIGSLPFHI